MHAFHFVSLVLCKSPLPRSTFVSSPSKASFFSFGRADLSEVPPAVFPGPRGTHLHMGHTHTVNIRAAPHSGPRSALAPAVVLPQGHNNNNYVSGTYHSIS